MHVCINFFNTSARNVSNLRGRIETQKSTTKMKRLPAIIRQECNARGWTATDLARYSGVNQATISRILSGKTLDVRTETLVSIAKAFKLTTLELRQLADDRPIDRDDLSDLFERLTDRQKEAIRELMRSITGNP